PAARRAGPGPGGAGGRLPDRRGGRRGAGRRGRLRGPVLGERRHHPAPGGRHGGPGHARGGPGGPPHHLRRPADRPWRRPMSIELTDITLTYPDGDSRVTALDRVSLAAGPGELHAVVGPSGSGKSSLLAVAAALIRPDSGGVRIDGQEASGLSAAELSRLRMHRVGIVF